MSNSFFQFKQFTVQQDRCAMKVTTDSCLFGAWCAAELQKQKTENCLDIGTGTGLLALMIAQKNEMMIDAVELDAGAAAQAVENITASSWKQRIHVAQQNILQWPEEKKYDVIFSNPPFYQNELKSARQIKNLAHHDEGLTLPQLVSCIKNHLTKTGTFFLLLPAKREAAFEEMLLAQGLFPHKKIRVRQTENHVPFRTMVQGGKTPASQLHQSEISIKSEEGKYTNSFVSLLTDYYLYL